MADKFNTYFHHIEALLASGHVIYGVAHGEENSFDTAGPGRVVEFGIAVATAEQSIFGNILKRSALFQDSEFPIGGLRG